MLKLIITYRNCGLSFLLTKLFVFFMRPAGGEVVCLWDDVVLWSLACSAACVEERAGSVSVGLI